MGVVSFLTQGIRELIQHPPGLVTRDRLAKRARRAEGKRGGGGSGGVRRSDRISVPSGFRLSVRSSSFCHQYIARPHPALFLSLTLITPVVFSSFFLTTFFLSYFLSLSFSQLTTLSIQVNFTPKT